MSTWERSVALWVMGLSSIVGCAEPDDSAGIGSGGTVSDAGAGGTSGTGALGAGGTSVASGGAGSGGAMSGGGAPAVCTAGHADCDGKSENGCETSTDDDIFHCGACGHACKLPHSSAVCETGQCIVKCLDGWGDCDTDAKNGCEAPLTQATNCGACGVSCTGNGPNTVGECNAGACAAKCTKGFDDCSAAPGCETDVDSDPKNCGACGHDCGGQKCSAGECEPDVVYSDPSSNPVGLALGVDAVFWTDNWLDQVARTPKSGGTATVLASNTLGPWGIALDSTNVYFASDGDEAIWKVPLAGGSASKLAEVPALGTTAGLAVHGSTLYWLGGDTLRATPTQGGVTTVLGSATTPSSLTLVVEPTAAYWGGWLEGSVLSLPLAGGTPSTVASASYPSEVDADALALYYGDDSGLWKVAKGGGAPLLLDAKSIGVTNVATDGANVYYSDGSELWKIGVSGGSPKLLQTVAGVGQIRVDASHVYWTEGATGRVLRLPK